MKSSVLFLLCCCFIVSSLPINDTDIKYAANDEGKEDVKFEFFVFNWPRIAVPAVICTWILVSNLSRISFHLNGRLSGVVPDSALLILCGVVLGLILKYLNVPTSGFALSSHAFFIYLLPPIILEAGYFMPNRALFENVWPIASFALLGTCFNAVAIGFSLIGIAQVMPFSIQFTTIQLFLFSSLISACDPVAVIAFFEEIHVNAFLYVSVMGEALFNDSVVVMLYQMFSKFLAMGEENLLPVHYVQGVLSLLFIACGGALLGAICGFVAAFITKYSHRADTANPTTVLLFAYISFLLAELFGISSIISTTVYGMVAKQYVKENTEWQTSMSISYFVRVVSQASNAVTYLFLGLVLISIPSHYDVWFIIWTLVFCTIFRIIAVIVQCLYFNRFHYPRYTVIDQFILCFGGLRGAIAYGLALDIPDSVEAKPMFATTCLMVIYFTVFIQGVPMPYIVQWLKIKREHHDSNLMAGFHNICNNYTRSAIEAIIGQKYMHSCCQKYERVNAKYMGPALIRNKKRQEFDASRIVRNYSKATVSNAIAEMKFTDLNKTRNDQIELRERHGKEN